MEQINKYSVQEIGEKQISKLTGQDQALISSYTLENVPFILGKYQLDALFYTLDGIFLETRSNIQSYSVLGTNQGSSAVEIAVNPVQDVLDNGYLGDVQIGYRVTNNLFSPSQSVDSKSTLYIQEISTDRTEIRATSLDIPEEELQVFAQNLWQRFTEGPYFTGATLSFLGEELSSWCINVMTEVLDGRLVVTFKLYEPLPASLGIKSRFTVLEQIGGLKKFEVIRTVEVLEDEDQLPTLKGPNFDIDVKASNTGIVTDYLNYRQLFSYPSRSNNLGLYSICKDRGIELGIDHSKFSNFIHFSSAAERLENFRFKLGLLQEYEQELNVIDQESEKLRIKQLIQGLIDNFDHYDRYLYFESAETAWPKINSDRPYINASLEEAEEWFERMLEVAHEYDEQNPDRLIKTIPQAIRTNVQNEPYIVFVDMVGHHFDEEWLYAKAVSSRFSGDNRLEVGIPKDLVQDALRSFGIELQTTNQNLERIFDLCIPGEDYNKGSELSVQYFERATEDIGGTTFQPVYVENYRKEVYKRIYHNVPLLLKTKGTARGLRALINCFGIPESILDIEVQGGRPLGGTVSFGPEYYTSESVNRIEDKGMGVEAPLMFSLEEGQFVPGTVLSRFRNIRQPEPETQKSTNHVTVGFDLNKQFNSQVKDYLTDFGNFNYDDIIGDPRNTEENYGEAFSLLRTQILPELWDPQGKLQIRTPSAILRLVRYIDSVLFRTIGSFIAARDEISVGAIVGDNILHRNRYKGVSPKGTDVNELSDNIQTIFIDGGEGGSLKVLRGGRPANKPVLSQSFEIRATTARTVTEYRELPTVNYVENNAVSTGFGYQPSVVFDDSPKYTGELSGTISEVTNGELNEENRFKKGGSSVEQLTYQVDFRFLCLPAMPMDTVVQVYGSFIGNRFNVIPGKTGLVSAYVNTVLLSDPKTVIASVEDGVIFTTKCEWKNQQGWLFSDDLVDLYSNYIGLDMFPDLEAGQSLEVEMNRAAGQRAILLPGNSTDDQMIGTFGEKSLESTRLFWEQVVEGNLFQNVFARYISPFETGLPKTLEISLKGERTWPSLEGGAQSLESVSECYNLTTEDGGRQQLNTLNRLYGEHKLYKIYVVVHSEGINQLAVLDLETGEYRDWDNMEDTILWATLRGYPDNWDSRTYVTARYVQDVSPQFDIIGIVLGDSETGTGLDNPKVLIEPYMGIPYVFVKDLNDSLLFQLRVAGWRPVEI